MRTKLPKISKTLDQNLVITNNIEASVDLENEIKDLINRSYHPFYACMHKDPDKYCRMDYDPEHSILDHISRNEQFCLYFEHQLAGTIRFSVPELTLNPNTKIEEMTSYIGLLAIDPKYSKNGFSNLMMNFSKELFSRLNKSEKLEELKVVRLTLLTLTPVTSDFLPFRFLEKWYAKHGFELIHVRDAMEDANAGKLFREKIKYEKLEFKEFEYRL